MFYCYKITNLINNKVYIGKTNNIKVRWLAHKSRSFNINDSRYNYPISNAFRKYGVDNFKIETLASCDTEDEINNHEINFIAYYRSNINVYGKLFGYNLTDGGEGAIGWKPTDETRRKMSESHKGLRTTKESLMRRSKSRTGIYHTEETKILLRDNSKTAKLNLEIAELIRNEYKNGGTSHSKLAIKYNVSPSNIGNIINNKIWRK